MVLSEAGEIDPSERRSLDAHLDGCAACSARAASVAETMAAIRSDPAPDPGPLYWASFQDRLETRLAARRRAGRRLMSLAAAAAVLLAVGLGVLTRGRLHPGAGGLEVAGRPAGAGGATGAGDAASAEARLEAAIATLAGQDSGSTRFEAILDDLLPEEPADLEESLTPGITEEGATATSESPSC
jgi:anti-sigma factor RsiW